MVNTSQYIPGESVSSIILRNDEYPDYPFFSGTGFFAYFPPYEHIFFITAKHCILNSEDKLLGELEIPYVNDGKSKEAIQFYEYITTKYFDDEKEFEDVIVFVVGETILEHRKILKSRALKLHHQEDVDTIFSYLIGVGGKVRTIGFPSVSKEIDYDKNQAIATPRGFHCNLVGNSELKNRYKLEDLNWKDGELGGFSGSPIIELVSHVGGEIKPVVIGVLLTGSSNKIAHCISINVVTNLISSYITSLPIPLKKKLKRMILQLRKKICNFMGASCKTPRQPRLMLKHLVSRTNF